jgi:ribulose bisphosphate carboxylase small subunit
MQSTIVNCFCQCGYGHEINVEIYADSSPEEGNNTFHGEWIQLGTEKDVLQGLCSCRQ